MIVSYRLLSRYVDLSKIAPEELVQRLTFSGFEVEDCHPLAQGSKLVVGKILSCQKHPQSDHLHLLKVDCGKVLGVLDIVCGAPNARQGIKVIVALPGCHLPAIGKTIEAGVIRNAPSNGMCCSLVELGLSKEVLPKQESEGIHELDDSYKEGDTAILKHMGLEDTILEVNVLPNRPDALSILGFAREVSALFDVPLIPPKAFPLSKIKKMRLGKTSLPACPKLDLCKVTLKGFDEKKAKELSHTLLLGGSSSVSPLVDVGNVAMLLTGQPFHIYDYGKIKTRELSIKDDYEGKFLGLDGKEYDLKKGDLVVASKEEPLSLAGILGGEKTKVDEKTTEILIEAASFYHADIRHTSARLGLSSPSSILFGKGVNPWMVDDALSVMLSLLLSLYPQSEVEGIEKSSCGTLKENPPFPYSLEKTNHRLGSDYTSKEATKVLKAFGIKKNKDGLFVSPKWRVDLKEQSDIDEEIFRYYPSSRITLSYEGTPLTKGGLTAKQAGEWDIRNLLVSNGLYGVMTFTLVDRKQSEDIRVFAEEGTYRVSNPLTNDHEYVRVDLLPSLIECVRYNVSHRKEDFGIFEISAVDTPKGNKRLLAIALHGNKKDQGGYGQRPYDFFDLSGIFKAIFTLLGIQDNRYSLERSKNDAFHPGKSADILLGKTLLGTFGALNPGRFDEEYLVGEIDLDLLLSIQTGRTKFVPYGSFPSVKRDLSFTVTGNNVSYKDIESLAKKSGKGLLKSVSLFDHYEGEGKTSIGITLILEANDHTLKEEEINALVHEVVNALITKLPLALKA